MFICWFLIIVFVINVAIRLILFIWKQYKLYQILKNIPGPDIYFPFIGPGLKLFRHILNENPTEKISQEFIHLMNNFSEKYDSNKFGLFRIWLGPLVPIVVITDASIAQKLLNSNNHLDKATFYSLFRFAIRDGVFTRYASFEVNLLIKLNFSFD